MAKLLLIPGDGIGREVMAEAQKLLLAISKKYRLHYAMDVVDWGADRFLRDGTALPPDALETIPKHYNAILFGALGDVRIPDMIHGRKILLGLRFGLDLFINLRPIKLFHPRLSTIKNVSSLDMVIFRENTEDIYLGLGHVENLHSEQEICIDESKHSYRGVHRIIKAAFDFASSNNRQSVTLVDKANAIKFGGYLWQRVFKKVSQDYPSLVSRHMYVDVAAMNMVMNPSAFDVIVTSNLFGDILSDIGAGLVGGLGLCASANINSQGIALFEPVHGSAPDIAGKNKANPFAMFLSVALMMKHLGHHGIAVAIENAIMDAIHRGATTPDLFGNLSCTEASLEVINNVLRNQS